MEDNFVNRIVNIFWKLFQLNFYFLLSNIFLIATLLTIRLTWVTIPIYLVGIFFTIPAFQGLLLTLKRLKWSEDDEPLLGMYLSCYKELFKESCILCTIYLVVFTIMILNIYMITIVFQWDLLAPLYMLLLVLLWIHFIFTLLIRVNLLVTAKETLKLSVYFMLNHPNRSLAVLAICFAAFMIFSAFPQFSILILPSILGCFLLNFTDKLFEKIILALKLDQGKIIKKNSVQ